MAPLKRTIRRASTSVALVFAALTSSLVAPPAAHADHAFVFGVWTHAAVVKTDGAFPDNAKDAAYYWQDRGFKFGYYPPLPQQTTTCTSAPMPELWINVCTVNRSLIGQYSGDSTNDGVTTTYWYSGTTQIYSSRTLIVNDLSQYRRQQVWRHELGHAVGLGHTANLGCVMRANADVPPGTICDQDVAAIKIMYP